MSMNLSELLNKIQEHRRKEVIVQEGKVYTYADLEEKTVTWSEILISKGVGSGQVIGLKSDYSIESISLLLALWSNRNIVALVPSGPFDEEILNNPYGYYEDLRDAGPFVWLNKYNLWATGRHNAIGSPAHVR